MFTGIVEETGVVESIKPTSRSIELTVRIEIVCFKISIDTFAAGTSGSTAGCGLDHDQRGLIFLRNLRRRQPGLLQRGILAEQRFLQRPSHVLSLKLISMAAPYTRVTNAAAPPRAMPVTLNSTIRRDWQSCNVTRSPESRATRLTHASPQRLRDMRSSLTDPRT